MRYQGRITSWKDDRGFGFITPSHGGSQVFVHISAFANRSRRPIGNEVVSYKLRTDADGRPQAHEVAFVGDVSPQAAAAGSHPVRRASIVAFVFLGLVAALAMVGRLPLAVPALYVVASLIAFLAYAWDKSAAHSDAWRTSESTWHLLGLAGGWPGALVARHWFRHKTIKPSFVATFWVTVVLNCGALIWLLSPWGRQFLASLLGLA